MTSTKTAPIAVQLVRYDEPRKTWGLHIFRPTERTNFLNQPVHYDWESADLYSDQDLLAETLRSHNLQECIDLALVEPRLRHFICNNVVPMEWIGLLNGPDCEDKTSCEQRIVVWFTPGDGDRWCA